MALPVVQHGVIAATMQLHDQMMALLSGSDAAFSSWYQQKIEEGVTQISWFKLREHSPDDFLTLYSQLLEAPKTEVADVMISIDLQMLLGLSQPYFDLIGVI